MIRNARRIVSGLMLGAALAFSAAPAHAASTSSNSDGNIGLYEHDSDSSPALFDLMVMRPAGFAVLAAGTALMLPVGAITLMTRPSDIGVPYDHLMRTPAHFVFVDPIGAH